MRTGDGCHIASDSGLKAVVPRCCPMRQLSRDISAYIVTYFDHNPNPVLKNQNFRIAGITVFMNLHIGSASLRNVWKNGRFHAEYLLFRENRLRLFGRSAGIFSLPLRAFRP